MAKLLAILCLLASASLIYASTDAGNQAKEEADIATDDNIPTDKNIPGGRHLKQFGSFIPHSDGSSGGIGGFIPNLGGSSGSNSGGTSKFCGTTPATGSDPVLTPQALTLANKNCFIQASKDWHSSTGNVFVAPFLRACFHDCFPGHCDGSLFLTSEERNGAGNENILATYIMQQYRDYVYSKCSRKISYADAVRLGAATGVENLGGPLTSTSLTLGKKDSAVPENIAALPKATDLASAQIALFQRVFNTTKDAAIRHYVTLNGAHTLGVASCDTFKNRRNGKGDGLPNNNLDLQKGTCGILDGTSFNCGRLPFDDSPLSFDNLYYKALVNGYGLLTADQTMYSSPNICVGATCTNSLVKQFANNQAAFFNSWKTSFLLLCSRTQK